MCVGGWGGISTCVCWGVGWDKYMCVCWGMGWDKYIHVCVCVCVCACLQISPCSWCMCHYQVGIMQYSERNLTKCATIV